MASDNYTVIDGKKVKLTDEQLLNGTKAKIFVDEFSKSCPMLDYQKELLIRAIVNGCHNYLPYELEMKRLRQLYYYREMTRRLCELLFFNKCINDEGNENNDQGCE